MSVPSPLHPSKTLNDEFNSCIGSFSESEYKTMPVGQKLITPQEAENAIYVDYEGSKDKPPTLLGYIVDRVYQAGIVESLFSTCAKRHRAKKTTIEDHLNLTTKLLHQCEAQGRVLVSWSEHDYKTTIVAASQQRVSAWRS